MKDKGILYYPALVLFPVIAAASVATEIFPQYANHTLSVYAGVCLLMYLAGNSLYVYADKKSNAGVPAILGFLPVVGVAVYLFYLAFTKQNRDVLVEMLPLYLLKVTGAVAAGWFGYLAKAYKILSEEVYNTVPSGEKSAEVNVPEDKVTDLNLLEGLTNAAQEPEVNVQRDAGIPEGEERLRRLIEREKEFLINYLKK